VTSPLPRRLIFSQTVYTVDVIIIAEFAQSPVAQRGRGGGGESPRASLL